MIAGAVVATMLPFVIKHYLSRPVATAATIGAAAAATAAAAYPMVLPRWNFKPGEQGEDIVSLPALGMNNTLYIGTNVRSNGWLYAIHTGDGRKIWDFAVRGGTRAKPGIGSDGSVYLGTVNGNVYALEGATGRKQWEFKTGGQAGSPSVSPDGTVFVHSGDESIYAIDGKTGNQRWKIHVGVSGPELTIGPNEIAYVNTGGTVRAFSVENGAEIWQHPNVDRDCSPVVDASGRVYVYNALMVTSIDGSTGDIQWERLWQCFIKNIQIEGTILYVGCDKYVNAFDLATRTHLWSSSTEQQTGIIAAGAGDIVVAGQLVFDGKTGFVRQRLSEKSHKYPVIGTDGTVYVFRWEGLWAFNLSP